MSKFTIGLLAVTAVFSSMGESGVNAQVRKRRGGHRQTGGELDLGALLGGLSQEGGNHDGSDFDLGALLGGLQGGNMNQQGGSSSSSKGKCEETTPCEGFCTVHTDMSTVADSNESIAIMTAVDRPLAIMNGQKDGMFSHSGVLIATENARYFLIEKDGSLRNCHGSYSVIREFKDMESKDQFFEKNKFTFRKSDNRRLTNNASDKDLREFQPTLNQLWMNSGSNLDHYNLMQDNCHHLTQCLIDMKGLKTEKYGMTHQLNNTEKYGNPDSNNDEGQAMMELGKMFFGGGMGGNSNGMGGNSGNGMGGLDALLGGLGGDMGGMNMNGNRRSNAMRGSPHRQGRAVRLGA